MIKQNKIKINILGLLVFLVATQLVAANQIKLLQFEPNVVELHGALKGVQKFGPPNYGDSPNTDQKMTVPILVLDQPVDVEASQDDKVNATVRAVREIQLIADDKTQINPDMFGKVLTVKGKLFQAQTGHHYTSVVMKLESLK